MQGALIPGVRCWIGIDPGTVRVGVAVAEARSTLAFAHGAVATEPRSTLAERIAALIAPRELLGLVVGLPLAERGQEGPAAQTARTIGELLAAAWGVEAVYIDERYSSRTVQRDREELMALAKRRFGKRQRIGFKHSGQLDALAAAQILQSYLDQQRG